jgi:hypothetical protein
MFKKIKNEKEEKDEQKEKVYENKGWVSMDEDERDWDRNLYKGEEKYIITKTSTTKVIFDEPTHLYYIQEFDKDLHEHIMFLEPIRLSASGVLNYSTSKTKQEKKPYGVNKIYLQNIKERFPHIITIYFCILKCSREGFDLLMQLLTDKLSCPKIKNYVLTGTKTSSIEKLAMKIQAIVAKNSDNFGRFNGYTSREELFMICQVIVDGEHVEHFKKKPIGSCYQKLLTNKAYNEIEMHTLNNNHVIQLEYINDLLNVLANGRGNNNCLYRYYKKLWELPSGMVAGDGISKTLTERAGNNGTILHSYMEERLNFGKSDIVLPDTQDVVNVDSIFDEYLIPMFDTNRYVYREDLSEKPIASYKHKVAGKIDMVIKDLQLNKEIIFDFKRSDLSKELCDYDYTMIGSIGRKYFITSINSKHKLIYAYAYQCAVYRKLLMLNGFEVHDTVYLLNIFPGEIGWALICIPLYVVLSSTVEPIAKSVHDTFDSRFKEVCERILKLQNFE